MVVGFLDTVSVSLEYFIGLCEVYNVSTGVVTSLIVSIGNGRAFNFCFLIVFLWNIWVSCDSMGFILLLLNNTWFDYKYW